MANWAFFHALSHSLQPKRLSSNRPIILDECYASPEIALLHEEGYEGSLEARADPSEGIPPTMSEPSPSIPAHLESNSPTYHDVLSILLDSILEAPVQWPEHMGMSKDWRYPLQAPPRPLSLLPTEQDKLEQHLSPQFNPDQSPFHDKRTLHDSMSNSDALGKAAENEMLKLQTQAAESFKKQMEAQEIMMAFNLDNLGTNGSLKRCWEAISMGSPLQSERGLQKAQQRRPRKKIWNHLSTRQSEADEPQTPTEAENAATMRRLIPHSRSVVTLDKASKRLQE